MGCCGSSNGTKRYRLTAPDGTVHIYLTETEARIGLATYGGGTIDVIRSDGK